MNKVVDRKVSMSLPVVLLPDPSAISYKMKEG